MQKQENCRGKPKGEKNSGYRFRRRGGRSGIQCGRNGGGQCVRLLSRILYGSGSFLRECFGNRIVKHLV